MRTRWRECSLLLPARAAVHVKLFSLSYSFFPLPPLPRPPSPTEGVLHADVKPENIMVEPQGTAAMPPSVKLIDFSNAMQAEVPSWPILCPPLPSCSPFPPLPPLPTLPTPSLPPTSSLRGSFASASLPSLSSLSRYLHLQYSLSTRSHLILSPHTSPPLFSPCHTKHSIHFLCSSPLRCPPGSDLRPYRRRSFGVFPTSLPPQPGAFTTHLPSLPLNLAPVRPPSERSAPLPFPSGAFRRHTRTMTRSMWSPYRTERLSWFTGPTLAARLTCGRWGSPSHSSSPAGELGG